MLICGGCTDVDMWRMDSYRYVEFGMISICGGWADIDTGRWD